MNINSLNVNKDNKDSTLAATGDAASGQLKSKPASLLFPQRSAEAAQIIIVDRLKVLIKGRRQILCFSSRAVSSE